MTFSIFLMIVEISAGIESRWKHSALMEYVIPRQIISSFCLGNFCGHINDIFDAIVIGFVIWNTAMDRPETIFLPFYAIHLFVLNIFGNLLNECGHPIECLVFGIFESILCFKSVLISENRPSQRRTVIVIPDFQKSFSLWIKMNFWTNRHHVLWHISSTNFREPASFRGTEVLTTKIIP